MLVVDKTLHVLMVDSRCNFLPAGNHYSNFNGVRTSTRQRSKFSTQSIEKSQETIVMKIDHHNSKNFIDHGHHACKV